MRAAPRAFAPFATVSSVSEKRNPRVGATTRPMAASSETPDASFVTVDETAVADLNAFLRDARALLRGGDSKTKKRLTLVLGNEAADLDSVACAVSLAYALHLANDDETRAYAPVVCVPREDFSLRADARWLLDHVGVDVDALTFDGEIPFGRFSRTIFDDALRLVLVDHNAVASSSAYAVFDHAVDAVVDHHDDEKKYPAACDAVVVPTGSCATLVAEALVSPVDASEPSGFETAARLFPKKKKKTGEEIGARRLRVGDPRAALLLAAVLLDTQNLCASATRVHARDVAIVPILASLAGTGDVGAFHDELRRRRLDQSGLSPRDLLRRDYKQWRFVPRATPRAPATSATATSAWDVGVASFGVPLGEMASDARAIRDACAAFAREKKVDALALMCAFDDATTTTPTFRRQFAVVFFDADAEGKGASIYHNSAPPRDDALVALSARMFEPGGVLPVALGGLEPVADATALDAFGGFAFEQGDPTRSRKKAQPALAAVFEGAPPPRAARAVDVLVDDGD